MIALYVDKTGLVIPSKLLTILEVYSADESASAFLHKISK